MTENSPQPEARPCTTRREFLLSAGSATALMVVAPGLLHAGSPALQVATYPRKRIGRISRLRQDEPVNFTYPFDDSMCFLVKLGAPAGGGVGPDQDVVGFSSVCTHMGGPLAGTYKAGVKVMGPCPLHLTTFDLTRHGMVVAGHATQSLPQVRLEADGDALYATGVLGLIYGYHDNLARRGA